MRALLMAALISGSAAPAWASGQPEAAAAPIMLFFDWGKFEIQAEQAAMLDAAAKAYLAGTGGAVSVEGHSDRSGSAPSNLRSSRRRAKVVRDYLVARGVPAAAVAVSAAGEANPLIPTPDGVREPQNRRVDVRFTAPPAGK